MVSRRDLTDDIAINETFCQVAGIHVNCMINSDDGEMSLANKGHQWTCASSPEPHAKPPSWDVYVLHQTRSSKEHICDIFVFNAITGKLAHMILGLQFIKVTRVKISKLLSRLSGKDSTPEIPKKPRAAVPEMPVKQGSPTAPVIQHHMAVPGKREEERQENMSPQVQEVLCKLLGLDGDDIKPNSDLIDLGVDSLLAMELAREVEDEFSVKLVTDELMDLTDFQSLVDVIHRKLGISPSSSATERSWSPDHTSQVGAKSSDSSITEDSADVVTAEEEGSKYEQSKDLPASIVLDSFAGVKLLPDQFLTENKLAGYSTDLQPKLTQMCIVYILDAFQKMGSPISSVREGQMLHRVSYLPKHEKVVKVFYNLLVEAKLIHVRDGQFWRTEVPIPDKSAATMYAELLHDFPDHTFDVNITSLTGTKIPDCLTGEAEGIQLIMSKEGREHLAGWYQRAPVNATWINQLDQLLCTLFSSLPERSSPINILEIGAGTGGTTSKLVTSRAALKIPFCHTATDISGSLVAGLRKRFKHHAFMRFETLELEKSPSPQLMTSQHIVLATNCVHATHDLAAATKNIHDILTSDDFLILLEVTELVPWVDLVWGLVEGWWLANDGRQHALCPVETWNKTLRGSGFGYVDWTDGALPESSIQRLIMACASAPDCSLVSIPKPIQKPTGEADFRQALVDSYAARFTASALAATGFPGQTRTSAPGRSILVTDATGILGSHIVAHLLSQHDVRQVICLNRLSGKNAVDRQYQALSSRGLISDTLSWSRARVIEADTHEPMLGLSLAEYKEVVHSITDIVHNAWPMSIKRPVQAFEKQFEVMSNPISLARDCALVRRAGSPQIGFQFVSSVAVVGHHPFLSGEARVPEERVTVASAPPIGYAEAKLVCEDMLKHTLHQQPGDFRPMAVRLGQIAGSKIDGNRNPSKHLALLLRSYQSLDVLPDLDGTLSGCPVDDIAAALAEILVEPRGAYPIYHIENPQRQSWREMISILAGLLNISKDNIVSYTEWVRRVRESPSLTASQNPAVRLVNFFEVDFVRMSCGGLVLDTKHGMDHSKTLRESQPVDRNLVEKYIQSWRKDGLLD